MKVSKYNHAEAFCLMTYRSEDGRVSEVVWNSRDGVTPFSITAIDGKTELRHVNWGGDKCVPDYVPAPGQRIFVDLTQRRAEELAAANAQRFWDTYPPSREQFDTVEDLAVMLANGYMETEGSPDLIQMEG